MKKRKVPATIFCKQCKMSKSPDEFLWGGKVGRIKVRFCNSCAQANMKRYWSTRMVGRKPEEFRQDIDE